MSGTRKNTLVVDFSVLPVRPDVAKVKDFLENEIKLQLADLKSIQLHHTRNCVLIEMKTQEIAVRYQSEHNWKRAMLCGNTKFRIPVYIDCDAVTVRVHDLPPSMSHVTVADHMMKYGEVISIRNEKWKHYFPGISNGVRVLRMNLFRQIPSFITIENEPTMVSYINQPKSCQRCGQSTHPGEKCPNSSPAPTNKSSRTSTASKSSDELFNQDDFPPINDNRQKSPSPVRASEPAEAKQHDDDNNDDDWTDDDNASNSSTEHNEATNKRRRSRRVNEKSETKKKACSDQCSPNTDHTAIVVSSEIEKGVTNNKHNKGLNFSIHNRS